MVESKLASCLTKSPFSHLRGCGRVVKTVGIGISQVVALILFSPFSNCVTLVNGLVSFSLIFLIHKTGIHSFNYLTNIY